MKTKVDLLTIWDLKRQLQEINNLNLYDIVWTHQGEVIEVNPELIEEFRFTGLSNTDFIHWLDMPGDCT